MFVPFARRRRSWEAVASRETDETAFRSRRRFLAALGLGGLSAAVLARAGRAVAERALVREAHDMPVLRASRAERYADAGRPLSPSSEVVRYANFFEFGGDKRHVPARSFDFVLDPFAVAIDGLVERPGMWTLERIEALGLEERVYRHRCVEAWAMTVPWTGVPLARVLEAAGVHADARYVRFVSFDPQESGVRAPGPFPFPYYEALHIEEAAHELAFLATGLYGHRLTPQNGAPLRLVVPWKYGFKSAKSLVRLHVSAERPGSFWNDVAPSEYSWLANVDPRVPHPRWSQEQERLLGSGALVPTLPFNGYDVGGVYA